MHLSGFYFDRMLQSNGGLNHRALMEYKMYSDDTVLSAESSLHVSFGWTRVSKHLALEAEKGGRPAIKLNSTVCFVLQKLNSTFQDNHVLMLK